MTPTPCSRPTRHRGAIALALGLGIAAGYAALVGLFLGLGL